MHPPMMALVGVMVIVFTLSSVKPMRAFHCFPKSGPYQIMPMIVLAAAATTMAR